ncbi:hypothetical protein D3C76_1361570 [compost metagenome]
MNHNGVGLTLRIHNDWLSELHSSTLNGMDHPIRRGAGHQSFPSPNAPAITVCHRAAKSCHPVYAKENHSNLPAHEDHHILMDPFPAKDDLQG